MFGQNGTVLELIIEKHIHFSWQWDSQKALKQMCNIALPQWQWKKISVDEDCSKYSPFPPCLCLIPEPQVIGMSGSQFSSWDSVGIDPIL